MAPTGTGSFDRSGAAMTSPPREDKLEGCGGSGRFNDDRPALLEELPEGFNAADGGDPGGASVPTTPPRTGSLLFFELARLGLG